jgi:hypothetical protein
MDTPSQSIRDLALRLLELEAEDRAADDAKGAERVCAKLHTSLTRFAGVDGFKALTRRSLALARSEIPVLRGVSLDEGGCFVGLGDLAAKAVNDGGAALITHFLWLLVTFVGEPIALRLLREAWPEINIDE